jgi:hypothetical protein
VSELVVALQREELELKTAVKHLDPSAALILVEHGRDAYTPRRRPERSQSEMMAGSSWAGTGARPDREGNRGSLGSGRSTRTGGLATVADTHLATLWRSNPERSSIGTEGVGGKKSNGNRL